MFQKAHVRGKDLPAAYCTKAQPDVTLPFLYEVHRTLEPICLLQTQWILLLFVGSWMPLTPSVCIAEDFLFSLAQHYSASYKQSAAVLDIT